MDISDFSPMSKKDQNSDHPAHTTSHAVATIARLAGPLAGRFKPAELPGPVTVMQ